MEADLAAQVAALQASLETTTSINMEVFYWWCATVMVLIHAGFLGYEMGASRLKHTLVAGVKNILAFAFTIPAFFFFGWWIYLAMYNGFIPDFEAGAAGRPWDMAMGPNLADNATGVFWAAFVLFAATTASIMSGAVIERIRVSSFIVLAVLLGSGVWILAASWGWHPDGWMTRELGYHDVGCAGVIHIISGFFALGVLINLGPRIGKFLPDGTAVTIRPHNLPMVLIGLMLIIVGFFGFLAGCAIYNGSGQWVNIYNQPMTLSAYAFNTLMAFAGGVIGAYVITRDPFWMMSGALCGIISVAAGLDVYYPPLAFVIAFIGGVAAPIAGRMIEKMGIDDAVGAVPVHGICGVWGIIACGIFASGYPNVAEGAASVNFLGQVVSAGILIVMGFLPGYVVSFVMKKLGVLRVPVAAELRGLDATEIKWAAYPEAGTPASDRSEEPTVINGATPVTP